ncbi:hypothetical protein ANAPC5_01314 [Anaplasma phagocytophilum]|nr:hypothetical protein ANAPC5_01314 [Anaplasma phagocytophilum]
MTISQEGKATDKAEVRRLPTQGCPSSPLPFMLYLRGLEDRLEKNGLGTHSKLGQKVQQSLPGLM